MSGLPLGQFPNRVPPPGHRDPEAEARWERCGGDVDKFLAECRRKHEAITGKHPYERDSPVFPQPQDQQHDKETKSNEH